MASLGNAQLKSMKAEAIPQLFTRAPQTVVLKLESNTNQIANFFNGNESNTFEYHLNIRFAMH